MTNDLRAPIEDQIPITSNLDKITVRIRYDWIIGQLEERFKIEDNGWKEALEQMDKEQHD